MESWNLVRLTPVVTNNEKETNNVHPGNTVRMVNALIKANKRFDYMVLPGQRHGYGPMNDYFVRMLWDYFAEHLIGLGVQNDLGMVDVPDPRDCARLHGRAKAETLAANVRVGV